MLYVCVMAVSMLACGGITQHPSSPSMLIRTMCECGSSLSMCCVNLPWHLAHIPLLRNTTYLTHLTAPFHPTYLHLPLFCIQYSKELVEVVVGKGQTIRQVKEEILKVLAEEGITVDMDIDRLVAMAAVIFHGCHSRTAYG